MPRRSHGSSKGTSTYTHEDERRLVVLEFLMSEKDGGTANYIRTHATKLRSEDGTRFKIFLQIMVEKNWLEMIKTSQGGVVVDVRYKISSEGRQVIETIKGLRNDNNPLAKLCIFDKVD